VYPKLKILLISPERCDYRCELPYPARVIFVICSQLFFIISKAKLGGLFCFKAKKNFSLECIGNIKMYIDAGIEYFSCDLVI
jgi:hypothetical protein